MTTSSSNDISISNDTARDSSHDLLIIGAGRLSRYVSAHWHARYPSSKVFGSVDPAPPYVIFSAPANVSSDVEYPQHVRAAVNRAKSSDSVFVFTSSGSVIGRDSTDIVNETALGKETDVRAQSLSQAERITLAYKNGYVIRLSGLYEQTSEIPFVKTTLPFPGDSKVNVIHYTDAANAVVHLLSFVTSDKDQNQKVFVAAAKHSTTLRQMCSCLIQHHPKYKHLEIPTFNESAPTPKWKQYDSVFTRKLLNWEPKWDDYEQFVIHDAKLYPQSTTSIDQ